MTGQMGTEQDAGSVVRSAVGGVGKISWFAPFGMGFAERFVNRSLAQVTRYLTSESIRSAALESVFKLIGLETKVLIGHSLGSVIAYEAAHLMKQPLPLLLTLGSPSLAPDHHLSAIAAPTARVSSRCMALGEYRRPGRFPLIPFAYHECISGLKRQKKSTRFLRIMRVS
jgi:hypothetical protein